MRKMICVFIVSFLGEMCFGQEVKDFDLYRAISIDNIIDLTEQEYMLDNDKSDNVVKVLIEKDDMHVSYYFFELDKEVNLVDGEYKTIDYTQFVRELKKEVITQNDYLKKAHIKKAVSLDNLIYPSVLVKLKYKGGIVYYRSVMRYNEYIF